MKPNSKFVNDFPCRIGTTSYIIPDEIIPNLRFLKDRVDDVELVIFESDEYSNLPTSEDVAEMKHIAESGGLTFTIHLPLDALPGAVDEDRRRRSADKWLRVVDLMAPLSPFAWIVHLNDPPGREHDDFARWQAQCGKTLGELSGRVDSLKLCVETLSYDYDWIWPTVRENGCSVCMDIGHLMLNDYSVEAYCDKWLEQTRVLHLHGVNAEGRDHVDLGHLDPQVLKKLMRRLSGQNRVTRVLTLEIFSQKDLERSLFVLEKVFSEIRERIHL